MQLSALPLRALFSATLVCSVLLSGIPAFAAGGDKEVATSPKKPWGEFTVVEQKEGSSGGSGSSSPWWQQTLMWIPNRVLDFVDIFRVDAGVGPSMGAVVRLTRYGQIGYRSVSPFSLRVGDFGRTSPVMVETSNEFGIGPGYVNSKDRKVCKGELGVGLDVFLVGGYAGICTEELVDFVAGIFFIDTMHDDIRLK